jgi:hypothetical protein
VRRRAALGIGPVYTPAMARPDQRRTIYPLELTPEERRELDATAKRLGRSRAWVMRRALERYAREVETGQRDGDG